MTTVIKAGQSGTVLKRLSTVNLADYLGQAAALVGEAGDEATRIVKQANRESVRVLEEAKARGFKEGFEKGLTAGGKAGREAAFDTATERFHAQHDTTVSCLNQAIKEIDSLKRDLIIAAEKDLLDFAVTIAGKLTFAIGRVHRESAAANFDRALQLVGSQTNLTVRVNPLDAESTKRFAQSLWDQVDESRAVRVVADDGIAPGGCVVQTDRTEIDATIETLVEEMTSLLVGERSDDV